MSSPEESSSDMLAQLRVLSHRLSNSLEVILQAQYLLQRSRESFPEVRKKEVPKEEVLKKETAKQEVIKREAKEDVLEDQKWTTMIGNAAVEAAETNREIRDAVRRLSALHAAEPKPALPFASKRTKKTAGPLR